MKVGVRYEPVLDANGQPLLNEDAQPLTREVLADPMTSVLLNADKIAAFAQEYLARFEALIEARTLWHTSIARASQRLRTFCKDNEILSFEALAATSVRAMLRTPNVGRKTVKEAHCLCADQGLDLVDYAEWREAGYPQGWGAPEDNTTKEPR